MVPELIRRAWNAQDELGSNGIVGGVGAGRILVRGRLLGRCSPDRPGRSARQPALSRVEEISSRTRRVRGANAVLLDLRDEILHLGNLPLL